MDETHDWLFAKMAFDMNDLFHLQLYHLANTHDVADSVHLAALRTMSARHSVRGYLDRRRSNRGLVDCSYGPRLSSFPFYETAAPMDWIIEATNAAEVIDFVLAPMLEREDFANIALRSTV
ncbi:hypothetical protein IFM58399_10240 [Aspergillus lentulus]|uniref:Uncharacterized protein n=1 Tax=Aspergillus lentulus TaxID=293939 RepID=A0ABQ1AYL6_ASPLE|nr:uncharacterized protein IFM58399_10240 [Aspergillus lentulus]GFF56118.1 hypothetical protein IFM58399_10240 [Aspergillus lentulus]GFF66233.1 hypothetical protein IFM62136_06559 [Aspergillus lentulus]GFF90435.1 hypothetical protein IFM60648_09063 [Aspergillus lentulus]GFG17905.1 hypothetical protein IFM61392_10280 [Aspergillus lentulus]